MMTRRAQVSPVVVMSLIWMSPNVNRVLGAAGQIVVKSLTMISA